MENAAIEWQVMQVLASRSDWRFTVDQVIEQLQSSGGYQQLIDVGKTDEQIRSRTRLLLDSINATRELLAH